MTSAKRSLRAAALPGEELLDIGDVKIPRGGEIRPEIELEFPNALKVGIHTFQVK